MEIAVTEDAQPLAGPDLALSIEAILLTLDKPVSAQRLGEALGLVQQEAGPEGNERRRRPKQPAELLRAVEEAIASLNAQYESSTRSFRIETVAGGYRIMTLPALAPAVAAFHNARASSRLSRAAVETLAIIAYKQPVTRAQLEAIRGVSCGEVLRSLLERRLVEVKGRAEELGRPLLYGTGRPFLDAFGLGSLKDLPTATELQVAT
jgi:segregation and condensation protein B